MCSGGCTHRPRATPPIHFCVSWWSISSSIGRSSFKEPFSLPEPISWGIGHPLLLDPSRWCSTISSYYDRMYSSQCKHVAQTFGRCSDKQKIPSALFVPLQQAGHVAHDLLNGCKNGNAHRMVTALQPSIRLQRAWTFHPFWESIETPA